jgi:hypothetical protein
MWFRKWELGKWENGKMGRWENEENGKMRE